MLLSPNDYKLTCETCGKDSIRRNVEFTSSRGITRHFHYDCHNGCLRCVEHRTAAGKIDDFLEKCDTLEAEFNSLDGDNKKITTGRITKLDVIPIAGDACYTPSKVKLIVEVAAFMQRNEVEITETFNIKDLSVDNIKDKVAVECNFVTEKMQSNFIHGDF